MTIDYKLKPYSAIIGKNDYRLLETKCGQNIVEYNIKGYLSTYKFI